MERLPILTTFSGHHGTARPAYCLELGVERNCLVARGAQRTQSLLCGSARSKHRGYFGNNLPSHQRQETNPWHSLKQTLKQTPQPPRLTRKRVNGVNWLRCLFIFSVLSARVGFCYS